MRRPFLVLTTTIALTAPALAANPLKDPQSPELRQCIAECMQKKDAADREICDTKCVKADIARHPQNANVPASGTDNRRPQK